MLKLLSGIAILIIMGISMTFGGFIGFGIFAVFLFMFLVFGNELFA